LARFFICPEGGLSGWSGENLVSVGGYNQRETRIRLVRKYD
jgi:hypothetical protein